MARESHGTTAKAAAVDGRAEGARLPIWVDLVRRVAACLAATLPVMFAAASSAFGYFAINYSTIRKICHWLVPDTT